MKLFMQSAALSVAIGGPMALIASVWQGALPALGLLLGILVALLSIGSFALIGQAIKAGSKRSAIKGVALLVVLAKLPLFLLITWLVTGWGGDAVVCFLTGLGLVYLALTLNAVRETRASF